MIELVAVDQITVLGDADRLKQLFLNLVENAVKYTPPWWSSQFESVEKIRLGFLRGYRYGCGYSTREFAHIFDRFYRVDKSRARAQGGSGLGLSIAKWIAQAHGGAIRVSSEVGEGTTFNVTLPLYSQTIDSAEEDLEKTRPSLRTLGANLRR